EPPIALRRFVFGWKRLAVLLRLVPPFALSPRSRDAFGDVVIRAEVLRLVSGIRQCLDAPCRKDVGSSGLEKADGSVRDAHVQSSARSKRRNHRTVSSAVSDPTVLQRCKNGGGSRTM